MATKADAELLVQIFRWGNEMGLEESMRTVMSPEFDTSATMDNPHVGKVLAFGETIGTFVKHGVLDRALVVDLMWVEGIWAKVRSAALGAREHEHEPRLYENFEFLVAGSLVTSAA